MYSLLKLEAFLKEEGADYEILHQNKPILSVAEAKKYYDIKKAAPTFILQSENGLIACILSSNHGQIDFENLKKQLGFSKLKMADKNKIVKQIGYEAGAIPLIGHDLGCVFDDSLLAFDYIYGGTGNISETLKINPKDLKRLNHIIGTI